MNNRIIIIGGMGPQASLELHRRIIVRSCQQGAQNGKDFPEILHISLPIDDFISDGNKTRQAFKMIVDSASRLYFWRLQGDYRLQYRSPATA